MLDDWETLPKQNPRTLGIPTLRLHGDDKTLGLSKEAAALLAGVERVRVEINRAHHIIRLVPDETGRKISRSRAGKHTVTAISVRGIQSWTGWEPHTWRVRLELDGALVTQPTVSGDDR